MGNELCYLDARKVESPAGILANLELCSRDDERLGTVEGVILEPARRRVRYFVVSDGDRRKARYLLPVEHLAQLDPDRPRLRIDSAAAEIPRHSIDLDEIRPFSDEDLVTALFSRDAA